MTDGFGRYELSAEAGSLYCYPDSGVLRNRFDLRDPAQLKRIEADLSSIRQNDLLEHPIPGRFTPTHLCRIHRYLLGDVYRFAGHYRREDIQKGRTRFLSHKEIGEKLAALFRALHSEDLLRDLDYEDLLHRSAYYFSEMNYIHPFREGNGRAIRELMRQLYLRCGYTADWSAIPPERFLRAMEDSVYDTSHLIDVLRLCVK